MTTKRIWHGWTTPERADDYERLLRDEVFPGIEAKQIAGYRSIELLRRDLGDEVEFITIMTFDTLQSVIDFQGEDYQRCYVPDAAQAKRCSNWDRRESSFPAYAGKMACAWRVSGLPSSPTFAEARATGSPGRVLRSRKSPGKISPRPVSATPCRT